MLPRVGGEEVVEVDPLLAQTQKGASGGGEPGGEEPEKKPDENDKDSRNIWSRSPVLRVVTRLCFSSVLGLTVLTGE